MAGQSFRAGVAIVVRDPATGRVLAFERVDAPGQWQLPQGGLHLGEEPVDAAWRELAEEAGLGPGEVALVAEHPAWTVYEWPEDVRWREPSGRRGQAQRWFLFDVLRPDVEPVPDGREFGAWQWVEAGWLVDQVIAFRRGPYEAVLPGLLGLPT